MPTLTLAIPEELKKEMDSMPEINWSEVARRAISEQATEFALFKSIVSKSKLKEKDALELGRKVNEALYRKYKKRMEKAER